MKPLKPSEEKESLIQKRLIDNLKASGWLVVKIWGNQFNAGLPDLFMTHPEHGQRWVEVKKPTGRLTKAQRSRFPKLVAAGLPIWVATSDDPNLVHRAPNVGDWL